MHPAHGQAGRDVDKTDFEWRLGRPGGLRQGGGEKQSERTQRCDEVFVHGVPLHVPLQGENLMRSSDQGK
jgi:hypothetical protein